MQAKRTQQDIAKDLYFQTDLTHQQIADILDVSRRSVWLWVKNNRWQEMKNAARQMPGIILQDIYSHITAINDKIRERDDRCPTKDEVENLRKLIRMTKDLSKKDVGTYIQSYGELAMYLDKADHDLAVRLSPHIDRYVTGLFVDRQTQKTRDTKANVKEATEAYNKMQENSIPVAPDHITDKEDDPAVEVSPFRGLGCDNNVMIGDNSHPAPQGESPFRGLGSCDNDVIMCDDPVITPPASSKAPKPTTDDMDKEIADMLGLTVEQVRQIENDEITDPELKKIANMDIDKFLNLPSGKRPSTFRKGGLSDPKH